MKYVALADILSSVAQLSLLGFFMGCIYNSLSSIISFVWYILSVGIRVAKSNSIHGYRTGPSSKEQCIATDSIYDFIFVLCYGALFLLICYLTLDGVVRLYALIASLIAFFISKKTFGRMFNEAILRLSCALCRIAFCIVFILTYPLRTIVSILKRVLSPVMVRIISLTNRMAYTMSIYKTRKQTQRFFNSIPKIQ